MNILNFSSLPLWDLGKGKGRVSTILPIKGFVDRGHKVHYISDSIMQESGIFNDISVNRIKTPFAGKRIYLRIIAYPIILIQFLYAGFKYCRKYKPDVVYAHGYDTALPAFLLAKIYKARYVLRLYGVGTKMSVRFKVSYLFLFMAFKLRADAYILTNDGTGGDKVALSYGISPMKIHFFKNGIEKEWAQSVVNIALKRQIASNNEKILLSVSRLSNSKGIDFIIKALPQLVNLNKNVKLVIVGGGNEERYLKKICQDLEISEYVIFTGALLRDEIREYMNIADVFISMNLLSSMSNPVFEAMICGTAVVALNRGTTSELIKNGENGILIEDDRLGELPQIINNLLENNEERKRIAKNGQRTILEQWPSWEERVRDEVDLVEKLAGNKVGV